MATKTSVRTRYEPTLLPQRTGAVIEAVGGVRALAALMEVSPSQPSRWRSGIETPSAENARELLNLDYVIGLAQLLWAPNVASSWLTGRNAFLDGARPIDVLRTRGTTEVVAALEAEMAGVYA